MTKLKEKWFNFLCRIGFHKYKKSLHTEIGRYEHASPCLKFRRAEVFDHYFCLRCHKELKIDKITLASRTWELKITGDGNYSIFMPLKKDVET